MKRRLWLMLAVGVLSAAAWSGVWAAKGLRKPELQTFDARVQIRGTRGPPDDIVVIALDSVSIGAFDKWPIPRSRYARVLDYLHRAGARLIVMDIQFSEQSQVKEDNALIRALDRARPTLLATAEMDERGNNNVLGGLAAQRRFGVRVGASIIPNDADPVLRRVDYQDSRLPTLGTVAAQMLGRPVKPFGTTWIDYAGPPGTIRTYPFLDAYLGRVPAAAVRGKIVVIGATAPNLQDVHATPTGPDSMSGAELHANAIETVLRGRPLRDAPGPAGALAIILSAFVVPLAGLRLGPLRAELAGIVYGALLLAGVQLAFDHGRVVPVVTPVAALVSSAVVALAAHYLLSAGDRDRTRDLFGRFVPEPVAQDLLTHSHGRLLGGVRRDGTVLFADLRGFTALAEPLQPDTVVEVLNRYLGEMGEAVMAAGGTLVTYLGDGIMAVFGAPHDQADHADRALAVAREMLGPRLARFNAWLVERELGEPLRMGIGISSGAVMSGHVGSERRAEYTAVGDTTNVAARLEALAGELGVPLLVAEETRLRLQAQPDDLRSMGELTLRGRYGRITAWTLAAPAAVPTRE